MNVPVRTQPGHFRDILVSGFLHRSSSDVILIGEDDVKIKIHSYILTRNNVFLSGLLQSHLSCHCGGPVYLSIPELSSNVLEEIVKLLYSGADILDNSCFGHREDIVEAARLLGFIEVDNQWKQIKETDDNYCADYTYEDMNDEHEEGVKFKTENDETLEEANGENFQKIKFTKQETEPKEIKRKRNRGRGIRKPVLYNGKPLDNDSSTCPECEKEFPSHYRMRKHYRVYHTERGLATLQKIRICPECGEECKGNRALHHHRISHHSEKTVACDECDYTCKTSSGLSQHKARHHQEKAYFCDQCDKSYAIKATLEAHIRKEHEGVRVFCQECGFATKSTSHLMYHKRNVHEGKKYSCDQCSQVYNQRSNLILHMRKAHNIEIAKFRRSKNV